MLNESTGIYAKSKSVINLFLSENNMLYNNLGKSGVKRTDKSTSEILEK